MTDATLTPELLADLQRMVDKDAIRDVLHRYCRAVDRCDLELLKSCYWPDSLDDHGLSFAGPGHEFAEGIIPLLKQLECTIHSVCNFLIDVDGDRAFSECQWSIIHRVRERDEMLDWHHQGRYLDVLEKRGGEWRIKVHRLIRDADRLHITRDWDDAMAEAGYGALTRSPLELWGDRFPHDPVYKGFAIGDDVIGHPAPDAVTYWNPLRDLKDAMHPRERHDSGRERARN